MLTSHLTMIGVGVGLVVAGLVSRDVGLARNRPAMCAWRGAWDAASSCQHPLRGIEAPRRVASIVGDPDSSPVLLSAVALDVSSQEWIPSDRLLDQLRVWANSQLVAEHALRPGPQLKSNPCEKIESTRTPSNAEGTPS